MKLSTRLAGTRLKPYTTRVSLRQTSNFAAGIPDANPLYFEDTREGGVAAPPTFPVAVTWPVISRLGDYIQARDFPREVLITQVHYTEHLVLHRLVRPGDRLTLAGEIAALMPHRAGTHAIIRMDAADSSGAPVFTEYLGAMLRGVECEGDDAPPPLPRVPDFDPNQPPAWTSLQTVEPLAPYIYDGCTDIEFPIHTSPAFAREVGLPGIIYQGTATLARAVRELVNNEAGGDPSPVREIACTFTGMVRPGTDIEICCLAAGSENGYTHIFFEVLNGDNQKAIRNGYMKLERK
ncbi:MAG: MaoC family dehydratase N-terminal domain-containing protein [Desulfobacter sp.]|nr:MAG: MaoC family dehydratase N-terminal domain-containing protein [Desulfobacter sp.]